MYNIYGRGQACVRLSRSETHRHYLQELTNPSNRFLKVRDELADDLTQSDALWSSVKERFEEEITAQMNEHTHYM